MSKPKEEIPRIDAAGLIARLNRLSEELGEERAGEPAWVGETRALVVDLQLAVRSVDMGRAALAVLYKTSSEVVSRFSSDPIMQGSHGRPLNEVVSMFLDELVRMRGREAARNGGNA